MSRVKRFSGKDKICPKRLEKTLPYNYLILFKKNFVKNKLIF